jgi:O-antigen/teichoic acid export membrane protein
MLRVDTALYGGAILIDRLLALLLLPLLTRAIGAADYGAWTQALVVSGLLMPLVLFAFPTTVVRSFAPDGQAGARWAWFQRLGGIVAVLYAVTAIWLWVARDGVATLVWGGSGYAGLVLPLLLLLAGDAGIEFANAWLRAAGRIGWISAGLILRSVLRYAVVWSLVYGTDMALAEWLPAYAATQMALAVALLALATVQLRQAAACSSVPLSPAPSLRGLLGFSAPLVALALFGALSASVDRFLLVRGLGLDAVAVYAAAVSLCAVPAVFHSVLGFTLFPVLSRAWHDGRRDEALRLTRRALKVFVALALPLAVLIAAAGPWLLPWLATADYRADWSVFAAQAAAVVTFGVYQILLYTLLLDGRSARVLWMAMVAAGINACLNLLMIPAWGMSGAALAAAASNALMLAWAWPQAARSLGRSAGALAWSRRANE